MSQQEDATAALLPTVRRLVAGELRAVAQRLAFTPLSQREAGEITDYTAGVHAAARILELRADVLEALP